MIERKLYNLLLDVIPDIETRNKAGVSKLDSPSMMDLHLDVLYRRGNKVRIALAHYFKMNGDSVPDPDMEFEIDVRDKTVSARSFQNQFNYTSAEQDVDIDQSIVNELNQFALMWFQNNVDYGHHIQ